MGVVYVGGGCGFPGGSAPLRSCRLGGLWRGADPGGLVTNWKALPSDSLLMVAVGEERGTIEMKPVVGVAWPSPPPPPPPRAAEEKGVRFDQRKRVAGEQRCEPGEVVRGETRGER